MNLITKMILEIIFMSIAIIKIVLDLIVDCIAEEIDIKREN